MTPEQLRNKIEASLETKEMQLDFCATVLGVAAEQAIFLIQNKEKLNIPANVHYAMVLTSSNMLSFMTGKTLGVLDFAMIEGSNKEKLILVLREIYKMYKDEIDGE